jgi:hypothetical protein
MAGQRQAVAAAIQQRQSSSSSCSKQQQPSSSSSSSKQASKQANKEEEAAAAAAVQQCGGGVSLGGDRSVRREEKTSCGSSRVLRVPEFAFGCSCCSVTRPSLGPLTGFDGMLLKFLITLSYLIFQRSLLVVVSLVYTV